MSLGLGLFHRLGLGNVNPSRSQVYGVSFRDNGDGFTYYREGLAPYGVNDTIPESMLSVHNKLKRCVTGYDGKLKYYLDPTNSMFKEGSFRNIATDQDGEVASIDSDYGAGTITLTVNPDDGKELNDNQVGCYIRVYDRDAHNFWYALIIAIDIDTNTITLSHPHLTFLNVDVYEEWGTVGDGNTAYYMIGDARLGGQDGNVMVEIPTIYYRYSYGRYQHDGNNDYQTHEISLRPFPGARRYPKRYVAAFEGVSATYNSETGKYTPYNGWSGTWDSDNHKWTGILQDSTGDKITSIAGYYPKVNISAQTIHDRSKATGTNYHSYDAITNFILQVLILVEYANGNTQTKIGEGICGQENYWGGYNSMYPVRKSGDTISSGNMTCNFKIPNQNLYMALYTSNYNIQSISYRGIENPYGHSHKFVDGIEFINTVITHDKAYFEVYIHKSIDGNKLNIDEFRFHTSRNDFDTDSCYRKLKGIDENDLQILTHTWQSSPTEKWLDKTRLWGQASPELFPNDSGINNANYFGDNFPCPANPYPNSEIHIFRIGGSAYQTTENGIFNYITSDKLTDSSANRGGRLCLKS